jgi:nucleotide-binding universal stress UspA family protein
MTLETILLAVGPKDSGRVEQLAEAAIEVAAPADATVVLAHVFTEAEYDEVLDELHIDRDSEEATPDEVADRHATIRELVGAMNAMDIDHEIRGVVGERAESITGLATSIGADRVIIGGRQRRPSGKAVFGSTAQEVLLTAPCPVTFVRAET